MAHVTRNKSIQLMHYKRAVLIGELMGYTIAHDRIYGIPCKYFGTVLPVTGINWAGNFTVDNHDISFVPPCLVERIILN